MTLSFLSVLYRPVLSARQLDALLVYRYRAQDRSITHRYILGPFYDWLLQFIPLWLAPNAITLLGFSLPVAAHIALSLFPGIAALHLFAAVALLSYMALDNLDGRQARRTHSSSPLGQLFDHGCDALNITVSGLTSLHAVPITPTHAAFSLLFNAGYLPFYMSVVEEFHTGSLILREINGPNEGLLFLATVHIITALHPRHINLWTRTYITPAGVLSLAEVFYWSSFAPPFHTLFHSSRAILSHYTSASGTDAAGRRTRKYSRARIFKVLFVNLKVQMAPAVVFIIIQLAAAVINPVTITQLMQPLAWTAGLAMFDAICRVMIATVTKSSFPRVPSWCFVPFVTAFATLAFLLDNDETTDAAVVVVYACLVINVAYCVWYYMCLIRQVTKFLNIHAFSIALMPVVKKKTPGKHASSLIRE